MDALNAGRKRKHHRLLRVLRVVGEAAGKVRDMDVQVELTCSLSRGRDADFLVELLEYLGERRFKAAVKLHAVISQRRQEVFGALKHCSKLIDQDLMPSRPTSQQSSMNVAAFARTLATKLANCRRVNKRCLHSYRLTIKELSSILQLFSESNTKFIADLGKAKDAIGEWHDWNKLAAITDRMVGHGASCRVQKQVQLISREKLKKAIAAATKIRKISLHEITFLANGHAKP